MNNDDTVKAIQKLCKTSWHMMYSIGLMFLAAWVLMLCWGAVGDDLDWPNLNYLNATLISFAIRTLIGWPLAHYIDYKIKENK